MKKFDAGIMMNGDCLELMKRIPDNYVDMILCDLPYGTTACAWDTIIPFEPLWEQYHRIAKENAAIVLTASQPFTSALVMSNIKNFKYELVWDKVNKITGALNANRQPMRSHESICIFYKTQPIYNKQYIMKPRIGGGGGGNFGKVYAGDLTERKNKKTIIATTEDVPHNPVSIISIKGRSKENGLHPTQKPVALFEYLIKTYTNEGQIVMDNCIGSGTTAIAAMNTKRKFIGIEMDEKYYNIACDRIETHAQELEKIWK